MVGDALPVAMMITDTISRADESPLAEGMLFKRRRRHSAFALDAPAEGMAAFMDTPTADIKHR